MRILGINSGWHDNSAALIEDGKLVTLVETDRISRVKQAMYQEPSLAVVACLKEAGVTLDDIDVVAVGWDEVALAKMYHYEWSPEAHSEKMMPRDLLPRNRDPEVVYVPHHYAHGASGMYMSGFERAAVLVVDGRGECQSTSLMVGSRDGLELIREWPVSESLGNFYGYAAEWCGFTFWGPGKMMGLAPYGTANLNNIVEVSSEGYKFIGGVPTASEVGDQEKDHLQLIKSWYKSQYPFSEGNPGDIMAHANFAATVQNAFEEAMLKLVDLAKEAAKTDLVIITGGSGQNCTFNGKLSRSGLVSDLFVPPLTHDAGVSLGAALFVDNKRRGHKSVNPRLPHAYFGHTPTNDSLESAARLSGFPYREMGESDLLTFVATRISQGAIVGWFNGTAEIGQRALGSRSLLCDPRDRKNLKRVNEVKGREIWRPLAPSVLSEHALEFFEEPLPKIAEFMLAAVPVKPSARSRIPATVHIDGSARPQFVNRETNPRYWNLIEEFRKITGVPVIMNTSFNLASEPIVNSPEDAVRSFARSGIDVLVLGDFIVEKPIR